MKGFYWNPKDGAKQMDRRTIVFKFFFHVCGLRFQIHQKKEALYFRFAGQI